MTQHCALCGHALPDAPQLSIVGASPAPATVKARRHDPPTAKAAARLSVIRAGSQRFRLLTALADSGPSGLTAEQCATQTGIAYVSASTRLTELVRQGFAEDAGGTRPTSTGTQASVLRATDAGRDELARVRAGAVA